MTTGTDLALRVAARVHDPSQVELTAAQYLAYVNDANDDLRSAGWLLKEDEDRSTVFVQGVYYYPVPANFAYIRLLREEAEQPPNSYDLIIPYHQWRLESLLGVANIVFDGTVFFPLPGKHLQVTGQMRPVNPLIGATVITPGMESFLRERAVAYAADFLAGGHSELAQQRERLATRSWALSNQMLAYHPQEFRCRPNSQRVPGA